MPHKKTKIVVALEPRRTVKIEGDRDTDWYIDCKNAKLPG